MVTQRNISEDTQAENTLQQAYRQYRLELKVFFERSARDPDSIDDLMQALYLKLLRTTSDEEVRNSQQYLFKAAWNLLNSQNRKAAREREHTLSFDVKMLEALAERSNSLWIDDDTASLLTQVELERVINQLPRACQITLARKYRDGWSNQEIANELGVSVAAVKKYLMRTLSHFSVHFGPKA